MKRICVAIPSRLGSHEKHSVSSLSFISRAVESVRAQSIADQIETQIAVGVDANAAVPADLRAKLRITIVQSEGRSQAAALNAAVECAAGDYLAFLEDDDIWHPRFLEFALAILEGAGFVSSTQLEVDESGNVLRIQDFPTPSGWVMKRSTWEIVGKFNEEYRWHLDNEWLGRLAEKPVRRVHLVESTAPVDSQYVQPRPWLAAVLERGGPRISLARHVVPFPLVKRLLHPGSGMSQIISDPESRGQHERECAKLIQRFGRIPS